jgi:hypothetical protein
MDVRDPQHRLDDCLYVSSSLTGNVTPFFRLTYHVITVLPFHEERRSSQHISTIQVHVECAYGARYARITSGTWHFGEVRRIFEQLDGRRSDVVFANVHSVKRICMYMPRRFSASGEGRSSCFASTRKCPLRASLARAEQRMDSGTIFVSNIPRPYDEAEQLEALLYGMMSARG